MNSHDSTTTKCAKQPTRVVYYGVGRNSKRKHSVRIDGRKTHTYKVWRSMLERCYSTNFQRKAPTYKGCTVSDEWLDFQNFADWYKGSKHYECGYQVDKDILYRGNRIYSPSTCCLVPHAINSLLNNKESSRGALPQGVCLLPSGRFRAQISMNNKRFHIGAFDTAQEAYQAYVIAKEAYVKEVANEWRGRIDERVYEALMRWTVKDNM